MQYIDIHGMVYAVRMMRSGRDYYIALRSANSSGDWYYMRGERCHDTYDAAQSYLNILADRRGWERYEPA